MAYLKNLFHSRSRLSISVALGMLAFLLLPDNWGGITRALLCWNVAAWCYLLLIAWLMFSDHKASVRKLAQQEDASALAVLLIMSLSAALSLFAIVFELSGMKGLPQDVRFLKYALTVATVIGSWCLVATIFTFHYTLLFYRSAKDQRPLRFPDDEEFPDYWDFLYFSFTISLAVQTSDVTIMSRQMRKTVLGHAVLSFFFNLAILGFSINIAASLVGN
ncbi:DUF1345 domain-containing protein [Undibacterium sp. Ren11W]|uniref:DUF1345 domain-containing protein n=1 Tax=Undibacterium sp. Ren11W TaxID=3413045 RepID=UPI003BF2D130